MAAAVDEQLSKLLGRAGAVVLLRFGDRHHVGNGTDQGSEHDQQPSDHGGLEVQQEERYPNNEGA